MSELNGLPLVIVDPEGQLDGSNMVAGVNIYARALHYTVSPTRVMAPVLIGDLVAVCPAIGLLNKELVAVDLGNQKQSNKHKSFIAKFPTDTDKLVSEILVHTNGLGRYSNKVESAVTGWANRDEPSKQSNKTAMTATALDRHLGGIE